MAAQLSGAAKPKEEPARRRWSFLGRPWVIAGALTMASLFVVVTLIVPLLRPPDPEALIAKAYSEHRTLELRLRTANQAPVRVERGGNTSSLEKPAALLRAEDRIAQKLIENANDPYWLDAKAQVDMLDGNYESALKSLRPRAIDAARLSRFAYRSGNGLFHAG